MESGARARDLEVDLELVYEIEPYDGPDPAHAASYDPRLEVEMELVDEELADPWFHLDESVPLALAPGEDEIYEIDPVHPLRRLGSWLRRAAA